MEVTEIAKKILIMVFNKYKEEKIEKESKLEFIMVSSIAEACLENYPSYKILFLEEGEKLVQAIRSILIEIDIKDSSHMLTEDSINILVNKMVEKNLINVTTNSGSQSLVDLEGFCNAFKGNILRTSKQLVKNNEKALKDLLIEANIFQLETIEEVKDTTNDIKNDTEEIKRILKKDRKVQNEITDAPKKIMIRNIKNGTEQIMEQCERTLDLCEHFEGRMCKSEEAWQKIKEKIEAFTEELDCSSEYEINLSVCYTIAYYLGICLNSKTSRKIRIKQSSNGLIDWTPNLSGDTKEYSKFKIQDQKIQEDVDDIAICISITSDIKADVIEYLNSQQIGVKKVINFTLENKVGTKSVENGNHAWKLTEEIKDWLMTKRTLKERNTNLHIFIAAPVSVAFFLGQQSFAFNKINLYEFTGIMEANKIYKKSIFISKGERI